MLKPITHIYPDLSHFHTACADFFIKRVQIAIAAQGYCSVALCGGNTPKPIYQLLAQPEYASQIRWDKVFIFWGDERWVPHDHIDSNYRMACELWLNQVPIPPDHIYPIPYEQTAEASAASYGLTLRTFFNNRSPRLDLVLLGLGEDGHTASLFPHTSALHEKNAWTSTVFVPKLNSNRTTLTATFINQSVHVTFWVEGQKKAATLKQVLEGPYSPDMLPAQLICPQSGQLWWLLDGAVAQNL